MSTGPGTNANLSERGRPRRHLHRPLASFEDSSRRGLGGLVEQVDWPKLILWAGLGLFFWLLASLVLARHNNFWTHDYDLGIFDQAVWLLSRAESFITVRGLAVFGHHANLGFLFLVPFYWLGAGPNFLNLLMVGSLTLGAWPVFRYAAQLLRNEWLALVLAFAFLAHFTTSWIVNETFHPEVVAIAPFLAAYVAATNDRWRSYATWLATALVWKEDIALAAFMLGLILVLRGKRKAGLITMGVSAAWFLFATQLMIPYFSGGGAFYDDFFGELGDRPTEIAINAITDPGLVVGMLSQHDAIGYLRDLLAPFAGVPLLSPLTLLIGLPQFLVNLLSVHSLSANIHAHYVAMPLAAAALAMVEGVAFLRQLAWRRFLVGLIGAASLATAVAWSLFPIGARYDEGFWPLGGTDRRAILEEVIALPDDDDAIAATYNLVPHLTHRREIYTFPNPWIRSYWGTGLEELPDPRGIDWLLIDRQTVGGSAAELERILAEEEWEIIIDRDDVLVAERR
jgi:uncharacterized membrane protein